MSNITADTHIHLRAKSSERDLIDQAAQLKGMNRTQFIMSAALEEANETLQASSTLFLSEEQYDKFIHLLDNPRAPNAALKRLLSTPAPWDKEAAQAA
jgi:uncharacterized protein (DUF1778 family)